jgi:hypothetical protein
MLLREAAGGKGFNMRVDHILHGHEKQVRVRDLIPDLKHCMSYGCQFPKHLNSCCIKEPRPAPSTNLEYNQQATHMHGRLVQRSRHLPFPYILEGSENRSQDHMKQHEVARIARVATDCFSNVKALPSPLVKNIG